MGRAVVNMALLQRIADAQHLPIGWVSTVEGLDERTAGPLIRLGLLREASGEDRAELSARAGRPVRWAVQVTADGADVLLYARQRAAPVISEPPEPGLQKVALSRVDLDVLERVVALGAKLREQPAPGLARAVETARFDPPSSKWIMYIDGEQMKSIARAFFLERHGGASAAAANRFGRTYDVVHPPQST
ncbi:DUF6417 family protein [Streptomyces sp. NPDC001904]|uniref:DUF6417 family protein n=1 Tax=Streptomyces sp. NPDC001904 TaxID=3154531 RepID=UPI00331EC8C5